jgi:hypothetical protein
VGKNRPASQFQDVPNRMPILACGFHADVLRTRLSSVFWILISRKKFRRENSGYKEIESILSALKQKETIEHKSLRDETITTAQRFF